MTTSMRRRLLIPLVLIGLPMVVLYPLWTRPITAGEDDFVFYWPVRQIVADHLRSGQLPVWNPYMSGGVPLLADPQSAVLYPPHALFLVLPDTLAYSLCIFAVFATAGGGAYLYLRRIALAPAAAMFGAVAFMFCGFLAAHRAHLSMLEAAALLPWGLWCIEKLRSRAVSAFLWMVPVLFLALAAGHWPTVVQMTVVWLAYLLLRGRPIGRALLTAGAAAAVGLLLMGPQIAATASYLRHSVRADLPYMVVTENSFFPLCAALAFLPGIMCYRTPHFLPQGWWGPWHLCEMLGYVGLATMALAATAVWRLSRKPKAAPSGDEPANAPKPADGLLQVPGAKPSDLAPLVRAWIWILIGAGLWALGFYLPTYRLIYRIPVVGMVRCPARMLLAIDFALAALAAMTVHALAAGPPAKLARTARRWAGPYLLLCIVGFYGLLWLAAAVAERNGWLVSHLFSAPPGKAVPAMQAALHPLSSAVCVPVLAAVATAVAVRWFLRRPQRRAWVLVALVVADLLYVVRLIDGDAAGAVAGAGGLSGGGVAARARGERAVPGVGAVGVVPRPLRGAAAADDVRRVGGGVDLLVRAAAAGGARPAAGLPLLGGGVRAGVADPPKPPAEPVQRPLRRRRRQGVP